MTKTKMKTALAVESIPLDALTLDPSNVRLHPEASIEAIKGSLMRFGQQKPIVVNGDGVIVAGNGTLSAARSLGWTHLDAVRTALTGSEAVAFAIADNRTAEVSEWDTEALGRIVEAMKQEDPDLADAMGFDADAMVKLAAAAGAPLTEADEDVAPEPPADPHSKIGDVWVMGKLEHRVRCGDATNAEDVAALLAGAKPMLMVTDPPYGVEYDPSWRNKAGVSKTERIGAVMNDDRADWREAWALFPGDVAYVWHAGKHCGEVAASLHAARLEIRVQLIWAKSRFALSRGAYHFQHEPCFYAVRKGAKAHWVGDRKQSTVWSIASTNDGDATIHGTQKPLECMARPMRHHDAPQVYDPFLGSGTTLIAAELLNRTCYGMELDPAYVDVCVHRWQRRTGKRATHADTGELFPETPAVETPAAPPAPTS